MPDAPVTAGSILTLISYDAGQFSERQLRDATELASGLTQGGVHWLNVESAGPKQLEEVAAAIGMHPLALDDVLNVGQRPRVEAYGDHLFILARTLRERTAAPQADGQAQEGDTEASGLQGNQLALVLKGNLVVSFLDSPNDPFGNLRQRLREGLGATRKHGPDFLVYRLLDVVIDQYFTVIERYDDGLESLEEQILLNPTRQAFTRVNGVRRDLLRARRAIWPLRDVMADLQRPDGQFIGEETLSYMRDAHNHVMQVIDTLEVLREMVTGIHDAYLTSLNTRMNDIIKVLTVISTIFIPLTFLAGIYGMNFLYMPEYHWRWAYPALWVIMLGLAGGMIVAFRRRGWL